MLWNGISCLATVTIMIVSDQIIETLEKRLGRLHARQRLGIERDHEAQVFGQGLNFFHIENLPSSHVFIRAALMLTGLYWRGLKNAGKVELRHNYIKSPELPKSFDGFTVLQLSDLHVEMSTDAVECVESLLGDVTYDLAVLTGDYRGQTFGSTKQHWREWRACVPVSSGRSMVCWGTTILFGWCRVWKSWAYACSSMKARPSSAGAIAFTWPALMTPIITGWTI